MMAANGRLPSRAPCDRLDGANRRQIPISAIVEITIVTNPFASMNGKILRRPKKVLDLSTTSFIRLFCRRCEPVRAVRISRRAMSARESGNLQRHFDGFGQLLSLLKRVNRIVEREGMRLNGRQIDSRPFEKSDGGRPDAGRTDAAAHRQVLHLDLPEFGRDLVSDVDSDH